MEKEKKMILSVDMCELIISIIGLVTFIAMFIIVDTMQRILFFIAALYFAFNIIDMFKEISEIRKTKKIIRYSKKEIRRKEKRKLSY